MRISRFKISDCRLHLRSALRIALLELLFLFVLCAGAFGRQVTVTGKLELVRKGSAGVQNSSSGVVWLSRIGDYVEPASMSAAPKQQLIQKNKSFVPHLVVVQLGDSVVFPNKDPFFHNVFSLFEGKRFDLGLYEAGSSRTVVFDREGISYIFCNIHPQMSAVVVSLRTPCYGISDRKGMIAIPNVAPGRYEMHVWDERALPEDLIALTRTLVISESAHSLGVLRLPEQRSVLLSHKNK